MKVDDLVEHILEDRVVDNLDTRLSARLTPSLDQLLTISMNTSLHGYAVERLVTGLIESLRKP